MTPTLDFFRTHVTYREGPFELEIPIEFIQVGPDVLDIFADDLDVWTSPAGEPISPERRDSIVAWLCRKLEERGTYYTLHDSSYRQRREASYQLKLGGTAAEPTLEYSRGGRFVVFKRSNRDERQVIHLSATTAWTIPPGAPLLEEERALIRADISTRYPAFLYM